MFRNRVARLLMALAAIVVLAGGPAPASAAEGGTPGWFAFTQRTCFNPSGTTPDGYEPYGPTDVSAQVGDQHITVGESGSGTITVFKWPNPSFYNQVKYYDRARDATGRPVGAAPNGGSFAGIWYETAVGPAFAWLRDWPHAQVNLSADVPVTVTSYTAPGGLGLTVGDTDLATEAGSPSLVRDFVVQLAPGSPVRAARLVYFENFSPIASKLAELPVEDWCMQPLNHEQVTYDPVTTSIDYDWWGADASTGHPSRVALASGWAGATDTWQVGQDEEAFPGAGAGHADGYTEASTRPYRLSGNSSWVGQATGAAGTKLRFDPSGRAEARFVMAPGSSPREALAALGAARRDGFSTELAAVERWWRSWLSAATLPPATDPRVMEVAKRALITAKLAQDPQTGAIVASADTQGPYGEDWVRDGSFINYALDLAGYHEMVTRHNLFYARVQTSPGRPSPDRAPGNWAMTYYSDGVTGGPIPYEIDETGLGTWTLWTHATFLTGPARRTYLESVFPAITRAADYLTTCQDLRTGLQCPASEDDNVAPSETIDGAETADLGLRSALAAARSLGRSGPEENAWARRDTRLRAAIQTLYQPAAGAYRTISGGPLAEYGTGGWLLWPVAFLPYAMAPMQGEAAQVARTMASSLASQSGSYEAKGLLGLAHAWGANKTRTQQAMLSSTLSYLAHDVATGTGLFGEAWERFSDGRPVAIQDQPHVWEGALFYLSAMAIDPPGNR